MTIADHPINAYGLEPERIDAIKRMLDAQPAPCGPLPRPEYVGARPLRPHVRLMLGNKSYERHMTDEGDQLQQGLADAGYVLSGPGYADNCSDVALHRPLHPATVFAQDKRDWDPAQPGAFDKGRGFTNIDKLAAWPDTFRVTIHKDLLYNRAWIAQWHRELRPHAIAHYYHPAIVRWLSPWLENTPLIRTWHSLDTAAVPAFRGANERGGCILSGAINPSVYPLRSRILQWCSPRRRPDGSWDIQLPNVCVLLHPGYNADGARTQAYLNELSRFRVAICTSSVMGFALRKIIEATAAGCWVITDLPTAEVMPEIDGNMYRVPSNIDLGSLKDIVKDAVKNWDEAKQRKYAAKAISFYDFRRQGRMLATKIEALRASYANAQT